MVLALGGAAGLTARAATRGPGVLTPDQGVTLGNQRVVIEGADLSAATFDQIASGAQFTLALSRDGVLYAWGANSAGQLGTGGTDTTRRPMKVNMTGALAGKTIIQIAAAGEHAVVLTDEGRLYTWGRNSYGSLGIGSTENVVPVPTAVDTSGVLAGKEIAQVDVSSGHMAAVDKDGRAYTWGSGSWGQLGVTIGGSEPQSSVPVRVTALDALAGSSPIVRVAAGDVHTVAVSASNGIYAWGSNVVGQLGTGFTSLVEWEPVRTVTTGALAGRSITAVAAGADHVLVVASGRAYAWGSNRYRQGGIPHVPGVDPDASFSQVPTAVDTSDVLKDKTIVQIAATGSSSMAVDSDGVAYAWGRNTDYGMLGTGATGFADHLPAAVDRSGVLSGKAVAQPSLGGGHGVVLDSAGQVHIWGAPNSLGGGGTASSAVPVDVPTHTVEFGSSSYPGRDVVVDVARGTVEVTTPRHPGGDVDVSVTPVAT